MLEVLRVTQFVLIDELEIELGPGLNVVTGETGAGKSILVNALQLVLGGRARAELIRGGAEAARVEALFDVRDDPAAAARLADLGLEAEEEIALRRSIQEGGRSLAAVNGRLATAAQLRHLAAGLVDISSQHEHHTLVDAATHLGWLDAFGRLASETEAVLQLQAELSGLDKEIAETEAHLRARGEREDLLRYQVAEIEAANPRVDEDATLRAEAERLRHAERLSTAAGNVEKALAGREPAFCAQLARLGTPLREAARLDPSLEPLTLRLDGARIELEDLAQDLGRYVRGLRDDPARLADIDERLHTFARLSRKYGGSVESVLAWRERARVELAALDSGEERLEQLLTQRARAFETAARAARELSAHRRREAKRLGEAISWELGSLGMGGARVHVEVAPLEGREGETSVDGARLSSTGIDRVEFLIAPNPGEDPRPLRKVASGGELSRSLLALKRVLAGLGPVGLYVFDEVDAGVGGAVATVIGRKLREVARHHQVLCITHLPQIAVFADRHFHVRKEILDGRTQSGITRLDPEARAHEIARMIGGEVLSPATLAAAREMLETARVE